MDKDHPEWLTVEFLNYCIQSKERYQKMRTTSFTAEPAVPPGNNYGSYILRVKANLQHRDSSKSLSLIIKCPLTSGTIKEFFDKIYETEPVFYGEFLLLGRQLLNRSLTAEYFRSPITPVVVLEDLTEQGFMMADKLELLDYEHCRLYMIAAANLHAMSFAVHKQDSGLIHRMSREKLFTNDLNQADTITSNRNMMRYGLESFANHASELLKNERILRIVKDCSTVLWDLMVKAMLPNESFNTLNQGDPWLTNMMFKRDEAGTPVEIKLLDFQCLRYTSPANDLVFFIWTSADHSVLQDKQDSLYETYLDTLNSALEEMQCEERLSMKTLKDHVKQRSAIALWAAALGHPMSMEPSFTDLDAMYSKCKEKYSPDHNPYEVLYTENFCKNHLPSLVQILVNSGVFDHIESALDGLNS